MDQDFELINLEIEKAGLNLGGVKTRFFTIAGLSISSFFALLFNLNQTYAKWILIVFLFFSVFSYYLGGKLKKSEDKLFLLYKKKEELIKR